MNVLKFYVRYDTIHYLSILPTMRDCVRYTRYRIHKLAGTQVAEWTLVRVSITGYARRPALRQGEVISWLASLTDGI
jgi:hypothetical protein